MPNIKKYKDPILTAVRIEKELKEKIENNLHKKESFNDFVNNSLNDAIKDREAENEYFNASCQR